MSQRSGELLEIERVAAALLVESARGGVIDCFAEELASLVLRQSVHIYAEQRACALAAFQRRGHALRSLTRSDSQRQEHSGVRRAAQQRAEQLHGSRVSPVEIVEREHKRPGAGEPLEQLAYGAVAAVALVLERGFARREPRERGKDTGELGANVLVESLEAIRPKALNVLVERVDEQPEGQIPL